MKLSYFLKVNSLLLLFPLSLISQEAINTVTFGDNGVVYLEDFTKYKTNTIPDKWYNRDGDGIPANYEERNRREYLYRVEEEGDRKFLRYKGAIAKHMNFPLADKEKVNIHETPVLRWDWRIFDIPEGANEKSDNRNDVAASVYVVFDMNRVLFKRVPRSIRYTWSSSLPVGTETSKLFGNQRIIVVGSGREGLGEWKTFERNIVEDYRHFFGSNPPKTPLAILILSDGDDTQSFIQADYDNFELHPRSE